MGHRASDDKAGGDPARDELEHILDDAERVGKDLAEQGRTRTEKGTVMSDLASTFRAVLDQVPQSVTLTGLEDPIEDWRAYLEAGRKERDRMAGHEYGAITSASGTATLSSAHSMMTFVCLVPQSARPLAEEAVQSFNAVLARTASKEKVVELMKAFGLDKSHHGRISAIRQFITAYDALQRPVSGDFDPASTSIIPMREAIETTIDHLLDLRPTRSNLVAAEGQNKDWRKVAAIADQLRKDFVTPEQIQSWARDWCFLKRSTLSPSKTEPINRSTWERRINEATIFLASLMSGLDPAKLRRD
ncbi:MAG: hypothetical protein ABSG98_06365 [Anaerolineales bacterium]|jgi:hypothetical protein